MGRLATMFMFRRKIAIVLLVVGVLIWIADAAIDSFVFGRGDLFGSLLLNITPHEVFSRLFFIAIYSALMVFLLSSVGKRRRANNELRKHLTAIETSMDGVAIFNERREILYVNEAYAQITGFTGPLELVGKSYAVLYNDAERTRMEKDVFPAIEHSGKWHGELIAARKDRTAFIQEASITRLEDGGCVCVMRDISGRKRREDALLRSERFLGSIFDSIHDPFCILDPEYTILRANKAYAELKNKAVDDIVDRTCYKVLEGREDVCEGCVIRKTFQSGDPCAKEKKIRLRSGAEHWIEIFTYPILDEQGKVGSVIEYTRDVTDRKKSEEERKRLIERLEYLSSIDGLTGLLNRRALSEQLGYEIERARRYASDLSVILCDLDNLKDINDTYGHLAGDTALQIASATIRNCVRHVDIAGRYGGDEVLIIVPQTTLEGTQLIAEKIRKTIQRTEIMLDGDIRVNVSLSMGVACLEPWEDIDDLVNRVDAALYRSKNEGKNRITVAK